MDIVSLLRKSGDMRTPSDVVALALKNWLRANPRKAGAGYQWKALHLPDGTELRMRYRGVYYCAAVKGDQVIYSGESVTPRGFVLLVTGSVRNPWRDLWIRRSVSEAWTRADTWRYAGVPPMAGANRRRNVRRWTDQAPA